MLNPFIHLINSVISLINFGLIIWIILGLLMHFDIINRHHPLVHRIYATLDRLFQPLLRPIREKLMKYLPDMGGLDLSPVVLILLLNFVTNALYSWFYSI